MQLPKRNWIERVVGAIGWSMVKWSYRRRSAYSRWQIEEDRRALRV